jgi:hypothetical protein
MIDRYRLRYRANNFITAIAAIASFMLSQQS